MRVRALLLIMLLAGSFLLVACGKKGEPEAPDKTQSAYPRTYPAR